VQLIDAETDEHLWASTYDRQLTVESVFAIQSEIALAIADALEAALSPEAQAKLQRAPTASLEAYDLYLRAIQLKNRANWDAVEQALVYMDRALALDPEFQAAWVLKARVLIELYNTGARTLEAVQVPVEAALTRALALDQDSGGAHGARAAYLALLEDPDAMDEFEMALRLDPNNVQILEDYARALSVASQPERALELTLRARDLDPLSSWVWFRLGRLRSQLGQLDEALEAYARIRELDPASVLGKGPTSGIYMLRGQIARSLYWLHEGWKADSADLDLPNWIVHVYIILGDPDSARAWLGTIAEESPEFPMTLANQAILDVEDGRIQDAVRRATRHLAAGLGNRWGSETTVVTVLLMDAVRRDDPGPALDLLRAQHPNLFQHSPAMDADNVLLAVDTAQLLILDGQSEQAEALLQAVILFADQPYALTGSTNAWRVTARARALALLGEKEAALTELEKQVDAGWRVLWRLQLLHSPNFDGLREEPAFRDLVERLEEDMRQQLLKVRAMEASGEIPAPPRGER
jgi:tetratricopeptide (TPR) repeat protein